MTRHIRWLLFAAPLLLNAGLAVPAAPAPADSRLGAAIDACVRPLLERGDLSGQLLVARHGTVIVERSWGFANRELGVKVTPESRFCVASITKPMTLVATFRLIEQRKIGYRDSIARWLPDFPKADSIRIEHLLRHRSGIRHELVPDSLAVLPRTAARMVEIAKALPFDFPVGARPGYSTGGYSVLARILELASGKDYQSLLEEHLFGPLGMTHSRHANAVELMPGRVSDYVPGLRGIENAGLADHSGLVGGGSVWSSARDLHRFAQGVINGRLGAAVRASLVRGGKLEFGGRTGGFRSFVDWDSATGLEVVFVGNLVTGAAEQVRTAVPRLAAGEAPDATRLPELAATPADERTLQRYVGDFQLANGVRLALRLRDGALYANEWLLRPTTDGAFFSPRDYGLVRPVAGPDGTIERLDWTQNGVVYPAPRVTAAR